MKNDPLEAARLRMVAARKRMNAEERKYIEALKLYLNMKQAFKDK